VAPWLTAHHSKIVAHTQAGYTGLNANGAHLRIVGSIVAGQTDRDIPVGPDEKHVRLTVLRKAASAPQFGDAPNSTSGKIADSRPCPWPDAPAARLSAVSARQPFEASRARLPAPALLL